MTASETIEVPAGRFQSLKVVRESAGQYSDEYWYVPEVRFYARWVGRRGNVDFDWKLEHYRAASADSRPASIGTLQPVANPLNVWGRPGLLLAGSTLGVAFSVLDLGLHGGTVSTWARLPLLIVLGVIAVLDLRLRWIPNSCRLSALPTRSSPRPRLGGKH